MGYSILRYREIPYSYTLAASTARYQKGIRLIFLKRATQLLQSLRFSQALAPQCLFSDFKPSKPRISLKQDVPKTKRERPSQQIIKKLSEKSEKVLNKTSHSSKSFTIISKPKDKFSDKEPKARKMSDIIDVKESQKGEKYKTPYEKSRKEVDPETLYYNLRKKQYDNPIRQHKYFKEERNTQLLEEKKIQQKIYETTSVEQVLRLYHGYKFNFSTRNLVTTVHRLGKFLPVEHKFFKLENMKLKVKKSFPYKPKEKRIQSLLFALEESRNTLEITDKMIIIWALTRIRYDEFDVYVKFMEDIFANLNKLKSDHLSLLAWCISHNGSRNPNFYGAISLELEKRLGKWKENKCFMLKEAYIKENKIIPRTESITLNQVEEAENSEEEDWLELEEDVQVEENLKANEGNVQILQTEELLSAQAVSILFWSYAKRNIIDENLFETLEELFLRDGQYFSARQMSNILFGLSVIKEKLDPQEIQAIRKRLNELDLSEEQSLTIKTIVILLNKLEIEDEQLYKKYIGGFLDQNKRKISPRFNCEILRVMVEKKIYDEAFFSHLNNFIVKSIKYFNLEDCLSAFESMIRLQKAKGNALMKDSNYSIKTTLDILVTKMMSFSADINGKQKSVLRKVLSEGKYNNQELDRLFA